MIDRFGTVALGCILSGALLGACANAGPEDTQDFVVRDSAGTQIVVNHAPEWGEDDGWKISEEPVVRIGAVSSSDPAYQFSWIPSVKRLSDGRLAVLDGEAAEVRWFDGEGNHLYTSGGQGPGPGEFNYPARMSRLPGDTVVVEDLPRVEHVLFGPDGEFMREEQFDQASFNAMGQWAECHAMNMVLPDRSRIVCNREPGEAYPDSPGGGLVRGFARVMRISWDLQSVDTLGMWGSLEQWSIPRRDGFSDSALHPFYSSTSAASGGDPVRIAIAINPEYSIEVWTPDGTLERIIRRSDARRVATQEELEYAEAGVRRFASGDEALANRFLAEMEIPDSVPAIYGLSISEGGELLARRLRALGSPSEYSYDVFGADGRWLGAISLPQRFRLHEIGEDYVLGVRRDEMDVPFVEMYSLWRGGTDARAPVDASGNHMAAVSGSPSPTRPSR